MQRSKSKFSVMFPFYRKLLFATLSQDWFSKFIHPDLRPSLLEFVRHERPAWDLGQPDIKLIAPCLTLAAGREVAALPIL
jgi:hypothetical protein